MSLRAQTLRRLAVLFTALLVMVGSAAALYWRNEHVKSVKLADSRATGMAAYHAGDYRASLDSLKYYVARDAGKQDAEALYAYGVSRARLEEPNGKHIFEGITVFNALLQLDPGHLEAKHRLLELYTKAYRNQEAIEIAERVLVERPTDAHALKALTLAHERQREYQKALAASEKLNEVEPTDLDQQLVTYELMRKLETPPQAMLDRAIAQQKAHPDDPRFAMLLAMAYGNLGRVTNSAAEIEQGKRWLEKAATQPAPDAEFVRSMVRVYDRLKMYKESEALLARVTQQSSDPLILRVLAQRQWQNGRSDQVLKLLGELDANAKESDTGLLAYRALALYETGKKDDARAVIVALATRTNDSEAVAWSTALDARFGGAPDPKAQLQKYQAALVRAPDNAIIRYLVGEAYQRLGETELAIKAWREAAELSPSWATPHIDVARTLAAGGRIREALLEAQAAVKAAPAQIAAAVTLASIRHRAIEEMGGDATEEARLLTLVAEIQKMAPGEPETLPLYANLLAKAGRRDDAIAAVRVATKNPKRYDPSILLRLAAVSRNHNLALEEELSGANDASAATDTPRLALAKAADLAATGSPEDGLAFIQVRAKAATTQPLQWQLAVTQYKELIRDPAARAEWIALGDTNPKDLAVQTAILKTANSARPDREFVARTIERVKALTGAEGQTWKLERARWLLGGDGGKDTAEAVNILTDIVRTSPTQTEARLLLAAAFEQAGNIQGATKELQAAVALEPNSAAVALEVARLMQQQNKFVDSRQYLERAAATADLPPDSRRRIATMLVNQGEFDRAIKVIKDAEADEPLDATSKLLLAEISRRANKPADAEAIYKELLAVAPPTLDTIRSAADFYASQGKLEEAKKLIDRLADAKAKPGQTELVKAGFAERYDNQAAAAALFAAATKAAPSDPAVWRHLVAFHLRGQRFDDARIAAEQGLAAIAPREDGTLKRLQSATRSLATMSTQDAAPRSALATLASAAAEDRAVSDFLTGASGAAAAATQPVRDDAFARLKAAASRSTRSLPLQTALVQWLVARKDFQEAGQVADRMMLAYPTDADPARLAASVWRAAGQYDVAASAIQKWRERSPSASNALAADAMVAELRLAQGDAGSAARVLQPHLDELRKDPTANANAFATLMRALVQSGRAADARKTLEPMLASDRSVRAMWLQLAAVDIKDPNLAGEWTRLVAAKIPASDLNEQIALGSAWYSLSARPRESRVEGAAEEAAKILDPIVTRADAPVDAILLRAALFDRAGDQKSAEDLYRRGLRLRPDQPEALNNLAYLILLRGGDLNESRELVSRAVKQSPNSANFLDTLGRVQAKQGDHPAAIASFKKALALEPGNLEALIGLASVLTESGKRDDAAALLPQIDSLMKSRPSLPPPVRRELDTLRATMKASL